MPEACFLPGNLAPDARPEPTALARPVESMPRPDNVYASLLARAQAERRLLSIHWELTHRCNECCTHCYLAVRPPRAGRGAELTTVECLDVLDQLADLGALYLTLSGGEPLVRQDFFTIATAARARYLALRIFSNGLAITPAVADRIADLVPLAVEVSLYGADPATHDAITRRTGSWQKTRRALTLLRARGVPVVIKTPLMRQNIAHFAAIRALATQLGARFRYDLTITRGIDGAPVPAGHRLTAAELAAFFGALDPCDPPRSDTSGPQRCAIGQSSLLLAPDGTVYPCTEVRMAAGNVRTQHLRAIWEEAPLWGEVVALRDAELPACRGCTVAHLCRRCHGIARAETGSFTGAPAVACRAAWARGGGMRGWQGEGMAG